MKKILCCCIIFLLLFSGCAVKKPLTEFSVPAPKPTVSLPASTPSPVSTPTATPDPDPLTATEGVYTIAWISDPQHYSAKFPETYYAMTQFLAQQQDRLNLEYIVHTGDFVHNYDVPEQWEVADSAMRTIDHIPNGVLAGNHDVGSDLVDYSVFPQYFGEQRYAEKPWYGGSYENNRGHYDLITLGNTDYLFVYLGYSPDAACIAWANSVFSQYPTRAGILCVHDYFQTDTTLSAAGNTLYNQIVAKNPNLYMVLCGHRYTVYAQDSAFDDDGDGVTERTVHQAMANYQAAGDDGGSGYMRFLQIDEVQGIIKMYTYSPVCDDYTYFDTPEHLAEKYPSEAKYEEYEIPIPWASSQE